MEASKRTKFSQYRQSGFLCSNCFTTIITYEGKVPTHCFSCGTDISMMVKKWDNNVTETTSVDPIVAE